MSSRCPDSRVAALVAALACLLSTAAVAADTQLRVCSDPDNLPYSDDRQRGFENRIAQVLADETHRELLYVWAPLRRGFVGKTLDARVCDVLIGVPADFERVLPTTPYYRSSYVFVTRAGLTVSGFDDPRLRREKVGVQLIGNDLAASPPGYALARHGVVDNVVGYTIYGEGPAAERLVHAVERGELGVGVLWGPQAGYFAAKSAVPLKVMPARPPSDLAGIPFDFAVAVGVRRQDRTLRDELDAALERRRGEIDSILAAYAVPRTDR